jgi:hypothetical protein
MNDRTMLTTPQAAEYLGVTVRSLAQNWHHWGLTPYKVGRRNLYRVADLERFLLDNRITEPRRVA